MKKFNPEKELRKIQKGNRNKVIYGVIALLLIIAIGSSYALYQIRYNKRIIYTTVAPFTKRDVYLAVKVNGETTDSFPAKDSDYAFSGYECDGDATVTFDPDKWIASVNATGPDKCTIKFGPKNINYDTIRVNKDVIVDETTDANLRFIGANPANYIWFNCLKYDGLTNENAETEEYKCERWRIIGLMNNMTIVNEETNVETKNQSLVKIIRADTIGNIAWDSANTNNWTSASLQKFLNVNYLNSDDEGMWITSNKDQKYKPISTPTSDMIELVNWNIGGAYSRDLLSTQSYNSERGTMVPQGATSTWPGRVALIYPSDYGFATSGSNNGDNRDQCIATNLYDYINGCKDKSWLYRKEGIQSTLTPRLDGTDGITIINQFGSTRFSSAYVEELISPSLYLKPTTQITGGQGTFEEPYIIK